MADCTGPISTLPGALYKVPEGMKCDDHPDRDATHRVQGETDSFGSEMHDMCEECYKEHLVHAAQDRDEEQHCEWHNGLGKDVRPYRDFDEGLAGPVYRVCLECRRKDLSRQEEYFD